ncbi:hypothetical protein SK128_005231 [Halocaridina rubra]|uniref:Uncharacterized protein n=1 Tax=Halocaridina rubra TaxID=373956 RepID=A0AAN9A3H7_HALRR
MISKDPKALAGSGGEGSLEGQQGEGSVGDYPDTPSAPSAAMSPEEGNSSQISEGGHPSITQEHSPTSFSVMSEEAEEFCSLEGHSSFRREYHHSEDKLLCYGVRSFSPPGSNSPPLAPAPTTMTSPVFKEEKIEPVKQIKVEVDDEDKQTYQELF